MIGRRYCFDQDYKVRTEGTKQKYDTRVNTNTVEATKQKSKSITLSRFGCSVVVQAGILFSYEGIWRRSGSNLTLKPCWNMTQGWIEAFRPVSESPYVVLLFFICLSPNKTRAALSDTHTLREQTRFCQSHPSHSLFLFLYWCFPPEMFIFLRESKKINT